MHTACGVSKSQTIPRCCYVIGFLERDKDGPGGLCIILRGRSLMNQMPTGTKWGQIGMNGLGGAPKDTVADDRYQGEGNG